MVAPNAADIERAWSREEIARELEDLGVDDVEGVELETAARPGLEEDLADDEIGRASEGMQADEG